METAEQFLRNGYNTTDGHYEDYDVLDAMVKFAVMHVEEALKQASEKAELDLISNYRRCEISDTSILNAYSLENIR